jgi:chemotaxis protein methyltransferase CheR
MSRFIHSNFGLKMPTAKKILLESRLRKRLRHLGLETFGQYCDYLFGPEGMSTESIFMMDAVTTNKTDFFREPAAFSYLAEKILPGLNGGRSSSISRTFKVWSAGCSAGHEPYTLAMVMSEFARNHTGFDYSILASDLSTEVLKKAVRAVYTLDDVQPIPENFKQKYLLRSKDRSRREVRIAPELRAKVTFRRQNLMEDFQMKELMDAIFCRNVIIYFDRPTQQGLLERFCRQIKPGGHIFMGHSETLGGMDLPLMPVAPMIYRKTG